MIWYVPLIWRVRKFRSPEDRFIILGGGSQIPFQSGANLALSSLNLLAAIFRLITKHGARATRKSTSVIIARQPAILAGGPRSAAVKELPSWPHGYRIIWTSSSHLTCKIRRLL